jgi:uncharacterized protein (TIGR03437 family)
VSIVISFGANAQFLGLATPADGSRVAFATTLRQKNTTQPLWGKLFQVNSSGLQLLVSRDQQVPPSSVGLQTNPYDIIAASFSADDTVSAIAARRGCPYGGCAYERLEDYATTVTAGGQSKDYPGNLQLSASGEWAVGTSSNGYFGQVGYIFNLKTGYGGRFDGLIPMEDRPISMATTGRIVADDGAFVYGNRDHVVFVRGTETRRIDGGGYTTAPVMDRTGTTIVYPIGETIRLADPSGSGSSLLIADGFAPSLSDDGKTLLYLANQAKPQLHIFQFGGASRQLGFDPDGIAQAILSGDGSTIYAVTLGGRLLKVSASTGAAQELIPRTPYIGPGSGNLAPGKLTSLTGVGLTDLSFTADAPLPKTLNGVSVNIQGKPTAIQSITPTAISVLVPPDVTPSSNLLDLRPVDISLNSPSPFEGPHADMYIVQYAPEALLLPGTHNVLAAHQDWRALVFTADPAVPGEVIHAYAVGLGDTSPAVAYGQPAPVSEPLARLTIPISCASSDNTNSGLEILYQGLAPGFAGIYQLDIRMPSIVPGNVFGLYCVWGGIGSGGPSLGGNVPVASQ